MSKFHIDIPMRMVNTGRAIFPDQSGFVEEVHRQFEDINDSVKSVISQIQGVTPHILLDALIPTYAISQKYCPIETGRLASSGYLEITENDSAGARVELGYAKYGDPYYAILVHERTDIYHRPPTRSKFLQAAVSQDMRNIQARVEANFKDLVS